MALPTPLRAPTRRPRALPKAKFGQRESWKRRLPLLPALIFMIILTQLPFVVTLGVSVFHWNALYPDDVHFDALSNYAQVFQDSRLRSSVLTSVVLTAVVVVGSVLLGLAIAILLNQRFRGRGIVRTMMIAPFLMVPVAAALVWKHLIFNPSYGLLNGVLAWVWGLFGQDAPQPAWLSDAPLAAIEVALVWQWTPFMMLIILAGLQSQPADVIEAARVDGAGRWRIFTAITLPHVRPYLELATVLGSIYIFQNFDAVFTMTGGGLNTANLPYNVYTTFFEGQDYGVASAMGVVAVIGTILLASLFLRTMTSLVKEGSGL